MAIMTQRRRGSAEERRTNLSVLCRASSPGDRVQHNWRNDRCCPCLTMSSLRVIGQGVRSRGGGKGRVGGIKTVIPAARRVECASLTSLRVNVAQRDLRRFLPPVGLQSDFLHLDDMVVVVFCSPCRRLRGARRCGVHTSPLGEIGRDSI